jgi:hypothetical protein
VIRLISGESGGQAAAPSGDVSSATLDELRQACRDTLAQRRIVERRLKRQSRRSEALSLQSEWKVHDIESGFNSTLDPYTAYLGQITHERLIVILCDATTA